MYPQAWVPWFSSHMWESDLNAVLYNLQNYFLGCIWLNLSYQNWDKFEGKEKVTAVSWRWHSVWTADNPLKCTHSSKSSHTVDSSHTQTHPAICITLSAAIFGNFCCDLLCHDRSFYGSANTNNFFSFFIFCFIFWGVCDDCLDVSHCCSDCWVVVVCWKHQ